MHDCSQSMRARPSNHSLIGMNVARLNTAHIEIEDAVIVKNLRAVSDQLNAN